MNVPRKLRDMFRADEGTCLVGADWAAIEWCVALWYASKLPGSKGYHADLFHRFQAGELDPHRFLASKAFNVPLDQVDSKQRKVAKVGTFGYLFGGYYVTLAQRTAIASEVMKGVCEAHDEVFKFPEWRKATVALAKRQHYIQTPLGWRRYFWAWQPKPTEVLATQIQATAADLLKWVLVKACSAMPEGVSLLCPVHDWIGLEAPLARAEETRAWLKATMEQPVGWMDGWRFKVDAKVGGDWSRV